ncbi:hypothetical protein [uncultured Rhodoblastus sp.]|uniref:hypothetical protein n=1 Tax=uncultured Rhodoblastus sp. TaxID=543037 RepID=UPI0025E60F90|nr:hypothetical protein [uncultured Rhodoblastus sp.]
MIAVLSPCFLPFTLVTPLAAQDNVAQPNGADRSHVRVQFGGGSAWNEMGQNNSAFAPLPAGPGHANYGLAANAQSAPPAQSASQQDRLRLKPMNFNGM